MEPEKIRYELKIRKESMAGIGRKVGVSRMSVCRVVWHQMVSRKIMDAVAAAIEQKPESIFPRYPKS